LTFEEEGMRMKRIVMKFGGATMAGTESVRRVARVVASYVKKGYRVVVVVSALEGVTDTLNDAIEQAEKGNNNYVDKFRNAILKRHLTTARKVIKNKGIEEELEQTLKEIVNELERVLTGIVCLGEVTPKSRDYVLSFGERLSAPIVSAVLRDLKLKTETFTGGEAGIVTDSNFGDATPLMKVTKHQVGERLEPLLDKEVIPVVAGFIAVTQNGTITTLGRSGSDYTATIVGAVLEADEVWIWKKVKGLMTADPKIVPSAKVLLEMSYQEAMEMAVFGTQAMHPRALEPAMEANVLVRIRNISNPESPGTVIGKKQETKPRDAVKAVTLIRNVALINVSGVGLVGIPGIAAKILDVLGRNNVNVLMISQSVSEANISS
jgi:aspartate kinase